MPTLTNLMHSIFQQFLKKYHHSPTAGILILLIITSGAYWSSACIAPAFVTSITSWHVWLKSDRCLITGSSTGPSSNGVHFCGYAFENKEDTLNIICSVAWICFTDCRLTVLFETLYFECYILNVHKTGSVLYASIKIAFSCWFALYVCTSKISGKCTTVFTCVSYAEARNSYRLDVRPSVRPSVRHMLAPYQNGWIYCHAFFTTR